MKQILVLIAQVGLTALWGYGCASHNSAKSFIPLKAYEGNELSDDQVATIVVENLPLPGTGWKTISKDLLNGDRPSGGYVLPLQIYMIAGKFVTDSAIYKVLPGTHKFQVGDLRHEMSTRKTFEGEMKTYSTTRFPKTSRDITVEAGKIYYLTLMCDPPKTHTSHTPQARQSWQPQTQPQIYETSKSSRRSCIVSLFELDPDDFNKKIEWLKSLPATW